jgi:signal transduction histidine kinase
MGAILIPVAYYWTILELTGTVDSHRLSQILFAVLAAGFLFASGTHYFVVSVSPKFIFNFVPTAGVLYPAFTLYFFYVIVYAVFILLDSIRKKDKHEAVRLWYVFAASLVGFIGGGSVFFLTYDIPIPPYPIVLFAIYPVLISYAIVRHGLFSVRIITTEILSGIILSMLLAKMTLVSDLRSGIIEIIFFAITAFLIVRVIKGVRSEVKRREAAEESDREKTELVAFAAHELRSPVTAMRGYASFVVDGTTGESNPETMRVSKAILDSGDQVLNLINQFLTRSKLELGHTEYFIDRIDVAPIAANVAEAVAFNAKLKNLTIKTEIDRTHPFYVRADAPKLKEVLTNLADNAIKYTKEGSVTIMVVRSGVHVQIIISDTGNGIPEDVIPNLFKKFSRADAQRANMQGSGIGLYLAKSFIEGMGARIWAESEGVGKGSRFVVEFVGV